MYRTMSATLLAIGVLLPWTARAEQRREPESPVAAAQRKYERRLAEAERAFLQARIAARTAYLESVVVAKRAALDAGDLQQAECLAQQQSRIQEELEADRTAARRIEHQLAPRARIAVRGEGFDLKVLRNGATAYSNRDYKWRNVPEKLRGWTYTRIDGGDTPDFHAEVLEDGIVYVLAESAELADRGWTPHPGLAFSWYPGRPHMTVFSKEVEAGQVVKIPHFGWTGTLILRPPVCSTGHL